MKSAKPSQAVRCVMLLRSTDAPLSDFVSIGSLLIQKQKRNLKNLLRLTRLPTREDFVVRKEKFGDLYK
jgi:hypothetical protein